MSKTFTAIGGMLWLASGVAALLMYFVFFFATYDYNYAVKGSRCQIIAVAEDSIIVKCQK